jgi:hypothetical protein
MTNTKTINGRVFSFGTLPAEEAVVVEVSIARVIGEPLFKAFMDYDDDAGDEQKAAQMKTAGAAAIGLIASKMEPDDLLRTLRKVFVYVSVDGERCDINKHFTGKNKELWEVFILALRHNFADFLPERLFDSVRALTGK